MHVNWHPSMNITAYKLLNKSLVLILKKIAPGFHFPLSSCPRVWLPVQAKTMMPDHAAQSREVDTLWPVAAATPGAGKNSFYPLYCSGESGTRSAALATCSSAMFYFHENKLFSKIFWFFSFPINLPISIIIQISLLMSESLGQSTMDPYSISIRMNRTRQIKLLMFRYNETLFFY